MNRNLGITTQKIYGMIKDGKRLIQFEVAKELGVSKQRISQIVNKLDLHRFFRPKEWSIKSCVVCGIENKTSSRYCEECRLLIRKSKNVELICAKCEKVFLRSKRFVDRDRKQGKDKFYCNNKCWGSVVGKKFGFGNKLKKGKE